jgi:hypothetical protein
MTNALVSTNGLAPGYGNAEVILKPFSIRLTVQTGELGSFFSGGVWAVRFQGPPYGECNAIKSRSFGESGSTDGGSHPLSELKQAPGSFR